MRGYSSLHRYPNMLIYVRPLWHDVDVTGVRRFPYSGNLSIEVDAVDRRGRAGTLASEPAAQRNNWSATLTTGTESEGRPYARKRCRLPRKRRTSFSRASCADDRQNGDRGARCTLNRSIQVAYNLLSPKNLTMLVLQVYNIGETNQSAGHEHSTKLPRRLGALDITRDQSITTQFPEHLLAYPERALFASNLPCSWRLRGCGGGAATVVRHSTIAVSKIRNTIHNSKADLWCYGTRRFSSPPGL